MKILIILICLVPFYSQAEDLDLKGWYLGVNAGQTSFMADYDKYAESSITFGLIVEKEINKKVMFNTELQFLNKEKNNKSIAITSLVPSAKYSIFTVDQLSVYGQAGLGFYHLSANESEVPKISKTVMGSMLGVGSQININEKVKFGVGIQYHNPFDARTDNYRLNGSYFRTVMTVMFTF